MIYRLYPMTVLDDDDVQGQVVGTVLGLGAAWCFLVAKVVLETMWGEGQDMMTT